jgi:tetratricopeptide (TPR) repeat protein
MPTKKRAQRPSNPSSLCTKTTIFGAAGLLLCLAGAGSWAVWKSHTPATRPDVSAAAIPAATAALPARRSASDAQIEHWAAQIKEKPKDDAAWTSLGDADMQKARETADLSYYGRAEQAYRQALVVNPKRVEAMIGLAWVNGGRHEFERSQEWAHKALALDPQNNEAYGLIGDADVEMGNYDAAFQDYQKMLDIRPDLASYSRGAHLLHLSGDIRKAAWLMDKAIKAGGPYAENTAWCRAQLALIAFSNGGYWGADQVLTDALKHNPNNYHLLAAMGRVKAAEKQYDAAIDSYRKAIAIAPQIDAVVALGDLYTVTGKTVEAAQQYALVETIDKLNKANGVRGDMQIALFYANHDRNLPEALRMAEEEYQTRKNVYAADALAWCYYKNGRYTDAKRMIDAALSRKTPEAMFLFHKGMIDARLGDEQAARQTLYEALSLSTNFHPIYAAQAVAKVNELGAHRVSAKQAVLR